MVQMSCRRPRLQLALKALQRQKVAQSSTLLQERAQVQQEQAAQLRRQVCPAHRLPSVPQ